MTRAIYVIMTSAIILLGTFAMTLPYQEATAFHGGVWVNVVVFKSGTGFANYEVNQVCEGPVCNVTVELPNRDENRFNRFCGSDTQAVVIPGGTDGNEQEVCRGNGPWAIGVLTRTTDGTNSNIVIHPDDVTINVTVI